MSTEGLLRVLGVIPARGGSKGIPRKNVRLVAGEPLIVYALRAAQESHKLTNFLTSTDDDEIADVCLRSGTTVLRRPPELARDETPTLPVVLHALAYAESEADGPYDAVVLLQPTAPIRTGADVDAVIQMLEGDVTVDSVISVCPVEEPHPARMYRVSAEGSMEPFWADWEIARRQDLPALYHRNGALYATRRHVLLEHHTLIGKHPRAYIMPRRRWLNIDDERDLIIADLMLNRWKQGLL